MSENKKGKQITATVLYSGHAFAIGLALGWVSPMDSKPFGKEYGFRISADQFTLLGCIFYLGAIVVCIPFGFLIDAYGRKLFAILLLIPYTIGWLLLIFANALWMVIVGRIVLGIASGGSSVIAPLYVGEIAHMDVRGALACIFQLFVTIGILFALVVGAYLEARSFNIACLVFSFVLSMFHIFVPSSPLFLMQKGKTEKAEKSLKWFRGKDYDTKVEFDEIKGNMEKESKKFIDKVKNRNFLHALFIMTSLSFYQQFSGINAVICYSTRMVPSASTDLDPSYAAMIIGAFHVIATCVAIICVDRFGRRLLLCISSALSAFFLLVLGIYFTCLHSNSESVKNMSWAPLTVLCFYVISFGIGFGPIPWVMLGELFPTDIKGPGAGLAMTMHWFFAFLVAYSYPNFVISVGGGETFYIYSFLATLGFIYIFLSVPDTKTKSLPAVQDLLKSDSLE